jgi:hypothetical protein
MAVAILDEMEMLDQQVAPARPVAQERLHLGERAGVDLAALGGAGRAPPALRVLGNCVGI